jgi:hypothetical protein
MQELLADVSAAASEGASDFPTSEPRGRQRARGRMIS